MLGLSCGTQHPWSSLQHVGSSSPTRAQTQVPCTGSMESQPPDQQGSPPITFVMNQSKTKRGKLLMSNAAEQTSTAKTEKRPLDLVIRSHCSEIWINWSSKLCEHSEKAVKWVNCKNKSPVLRKFEKVHVQSREITKGEKSNGQKCRWGQNT